MPITPFTTVGAGPNSGVPSETALSTPLNDCNTMSPPGDGEPKKLSSSVAVSALAGIWMA